MYSELDNQHHIKERSSFSIKKNYTRYLTFDEFVEFVTDKADEDNDPVYGLEPSIGFPARCRTPSVPKSATVRTM